MTESDTHSYDLGVKALTKARSGIQTVLLVRNIFEYGELEHERRHHAIEVDYGETLSETSMEGRDILTFWKDQIGRQADDGMG